MSSDSERNQNRGQFAGFMRNVDRNTHRLQFLQSLFQTNNVVYLDPDKTYCMISADKYTKFQEQIQTSRQNIQQMSQRLFQNQMRIISLQKEQSFYKSQYERLNNNQEILVKQLERRETQYNQLYRRYLKTDQIITKLKQQRDFRTLQSQLRPAMEIREDFKKLQSTQMQTLLFPDMLDKKVPQQDIMEEKPAQKDIKVVSNKLYDLLQRQMTEFESEFEKKIFSLQQHQHNIQKWEKQNQDLKQQNEHLKQKIIQINIEEEKLKIWRENILGLVNRVEKSIHQEKEIEDQALHQESQGQNQYSQYLQNEVIELRGKLVEIKSKMRHVETILQADQQIGDEGTVGLLVRLSQKLKNLVKSMIIDIQIA